MTDGASNVNILLYAPSASGGHTEALRMDVDLCPLCLEELRVDLRRVQEKWRRRVLGDDDMAQADACAARLGEPPLVELP